MTGVQTQVTDKDALAAVLEALDIPHAATAGHDETRQRILDERIRYTVVFLQKFLDERTSPESRVWWLEYFRKRIAAHPPVGYVTDEQAQEALRRGATWVQAVTLPEPSEEGR